VDEAAPAPARVRREFCAVDESLFAVNGVSRQIRWQMRGGRPIEAETAHGIIRDGALSNAWFVESL